MANPFYGATGNPVAVTRGTSSLIRAEFTAIQTGFDGVLTRFQTNETTMAGKGAIAGQVWSGTHDFTGAMIKVPTLAYGSSGSAAASIDYVNAAVINAATNLPGQTGNAGKVLTTNGTTTSWASAYPAQTGKVGRVLRTDGATTSWLPGGDLVITSNGAIDFGSYLIAGNYNITLPDLTTGLPLVLSVPTNGAAVPSALTTSDGWTVTTNYAAGTAATIIPLRADTPHGWWGNLPMSPPKIGAPVTLNGSGSAPVIQSSLKLSATCLVLAITDTGAGAVTLVAVDPTTGSVGNTVALSAIGNAGTVNKGVLLPVGSAGFIYAFDDSTSRATVYAATLGGANGLTITGASTYIAPTTVTLADTVIQFGTTSTFLAVFNTSTASADLMAFSVSGTTVNLGTAQASGAPASSVAQRLASLSATTALLITPTSSAGTGGAHNVRVVSLTGLTLTLGSPTTLSGSLSTVGGSSFLFGYGGGSFLYGTRDSVTNSNSHWFLLTASGTSVVASADAPLTAQIPPNLSSGQGTRNIGQSYVGRGLTPCAASRYAAVLDATHIMMALNSGALYIAANSGGTLSMTAAGLTYPTLLTDLAGTGLYGTQLSSGTTFVKLSWNGTTLTTGAAIAAWPSSIFNDNLNDGAVNYGGTWYKWTGLPSAAIPIAADKYINLSGTTLTVYGSFS